MDLVWEVVVNAAACDIAGRIFSYAVDNFLRPSPSSGREAHRRRLDLLLGSIASAVEEAQGRDITKNLNLLAQLQVLNDAMYRGRFALEFDDIDKICATIIGDEDVAEDSTPPVNATAGKRKLALRAVPFNAAKCARLILRGGDVAATEERLAVVTEELEALTGDYLRDFILLVQGYPRRNKVQWSVTTTMFIDQCVFGRHVETERVVAFLVHVHHPAPSAGLLTSALAVVGPRQVGKTTLVKHVVADERVRDHFARIKWFSMLDVLRSGGWSDQTTKSDDGGPEYLAGFRRILEDEERTGVGRCLLVFEDAHFVDDQAWASLLATTKLDDEGMSKVLFTCGNTDLGRILRVVELRPLSEEEYWYYFKAFVFGGTDLSDYPQMAAIGREISRDPRRTFLDTRVLSPLLRANLNARFWRKLLASIIKCQNCELHLDVLFEFLPIRARRHWDGYCWGPTSSPPKLSLQDVLSASASAPSSSTSGTCSFGRADLERGFAVQFYRETLYTDHWYGFSFKKKLDQLPVKKPPRRHFFKEKSPLTLAV
ncbi:hypothetical protein HU200_005386 [Digitaria exilis]|uniref:AAA+ ATPase domain-containing protein n=1 Tax=Digitaria exilis TaxID=1010633 RepID=A0A835FS37_9POAL|nr:hypothetical protein HU200_005386 [Digitaria exilis]